MWLKEQLRKQKQLFQFLRSTKRGLKTLLELNWCRTLYVNFKTQKFSDAIKFPIYIYGRLKICSFAGRVIIAAPIQRGMIKFGYNVDKFSASKGGAVFMVCGELIFEGPIIFNADNVVIINGICRIGELAVFGYGVKMRCDLKITIGRLFRAAFDTQIFDTNFHFTRNLETGRIFNRQVPIEIGDFCWIGNRTSVMKGTKLPDYSIVGGGSLLNKDYTKDAPVAPMIAGMPAKIISSGVVRVFSQRIENEIGYFFDQNQNVNYFEGEIGMVDEFEDTESYFRSL